MTDTKYFPVGKIVWTAWVNEKIAADSGFAKFIITSFSRHKRGDWGEVCEEDKEENELSLKEGYRLLSAYTYEVDKTKIWIITEADRSATTVLFPDEY